MLFVSCRLNVSHCLVLLVWLRYVVLLVLCFVCVCLVWFDLFACVVLSVSCVVLTACSFVV